MQSIKTIANDLALMGHHLNEDELIHHILRGLTPYFKEISVGIRARSKPLSFDELHEKFSDHEMYLQLEEHHKDNNTLTAQYVRHSNQNSRGRIRTTCWVIPYRLWKGLVMSL